LVAAQPVLGATPELAQRVVELAVVLQGRADVFNVGHVDG
jgi:hypothetical protein